MVAVVAPGAAGSATGARVLAMVRVRGGSEQTAPVTLSRAAKTEGLDSRLAALVAASRHGGRPAALRMARRQMQTVIGGDIEVEVVARGSRLSSQVVRVVRGLKG